ncbi:MAG TPA: addiction module antidote protein [Acetobacteraceae bacterium]|jgi:probable addiction module antidote protein|nr:addiction module antidote protein [Acetobacteraceae bacterium]
MTMKDRSHDEAMAEMFRDDPTTAAATLDAILADGDQGELLVTLRQMAKAFGGVQAVAKAAELNPTQLYRTLSEKGNPELRNLNSILHAMGMRLAVEPLKRTVPHV